MSVWAAIKYSINSKLGTDEFKPIDKLIEELGSYSLIPSSSVLCDIYRDETEMPSTKTGIGNTVKINISGSIIVSGMARSIHPSYGGNAYLDIYKNGSKIKDTEVSISNSSDGYVSISSSAIEVEKGDSISVTIHCGSGASGRLYVKNIAIYAALVPLNSVEVIS